MEYKQTLNLPKTDFPMKANLPVREPQTLAKWQENNLYQQIREKRKGNTPFILHDGPPYANGDIHLGTAFNKVLKDMIVRYQNMLGKDAPYVPGWDCHGMPIEHQVVKQLNAKGKKVEKVVLRQICREYADKYQKLQSTQFQRLGVSGEWDHPYLTMSPDYEAKILEVFGDLAKQGYIYHGLKPILWCSECRTALAEAEVEYADEASPSIYVKFPLKDDPAKIAPVLAGKKVSIIIWTTTPWTLPANLAVTVHPTYDYCAVKVGEEYWILAKELVDASMALWKIKDYQIAAEFKGTQLERLRATQPITDKDSLIILGEFVKLDTGTGCVHTAPGHGQDDYVVAQRYDLPPFSPVNEAGRFTKDGGKWEGMHVFEANASVVEFLKEKGILIYTETFSHSYPHCWRCKKPLIFRATRQWFLNADHKDLRKRAMNAIDGVKWYPSWGHDKIFNLVESRPDWCLSRQRAWGVPIPSLYCSKCDHGWLPLDHYDELLKKVKENGVEVWFKSSLDELFPGGVKCPKCGNADIKKEEDILDVWFDSGSSWAAVLEQRDYLTYPSDLYLEGGDQHRGWFQVSLLPSVALRDKSPYKQCATNGLVLDSEGKKMSKSLGNVISPQEIIEKYGADVLRLWFASVDFTTDVSISDKILEPLKEAYFKTRNTFRFLLGNLSDFDPVRDMIPYDQLMPIDRWILHRLQGLIKDCNRSYENYEFHRVYSRIYNFVIVDLSAVYLDILKDRMYTYGKNSIGRRAGQTVMFELASTICRLLAPIMPYTSDEIWGYLNQSEASVHLADFPEVKEEYLNEEINKEWEMLLSIREEVTKTLEIARKEKTIGHSLDSKVILAGGEEQIIQLLLKYEQDLTAIFIVSQVEIAHKLPSELLAKTEIEKLGDLSIGVALATGKKCARCWNYSEKVGENQEYPELCERCYPVVDEMNI
jgi:isoleucyl-tRNA synthetase